MKNRSILSHLHVYIAALFSQRPDRRAIVAQDAKPLSLPYAEPATTPLPFAPFVAQNYQQANDNERRAIVVIDVNPQPNSDGVEWPFVPPLNSHLSQALLRGRELHPLARHSFVECETIGYYSYERRQVWRTCALAAAYAGIFGAEAIEQPDFSYTQCCWLLSNVLGYDPSKRIVNGPTGRRLPVAEEMVKLTDDNFWNRRTIAAWLWSVGL